MNLNEFELPIGSERKINEYQKEKFTGNPEEGEQTLNYFLPLINEYIEKEKQLSVLDIGGGSGYMASKLHQYCAARGCSAVCTVLDTTAYDAWDELSHIHFVKDSAFNAAKILESHSFDLIFCNRLIHHLVFPRLKATKAGQAVFLQDLKQLLKSNGTLCITECTIESYIGNLSNNLHFYLTSIQIPFVTKIFRLFGAKSAGTGVYFRSKSGWSKLFKECGYQVVSCSNEYNPARFIGVRQRIAKALMLIKDHLIDVCYELVDESPRSP